MIKRKEFFIALGAFIFLNLIVLFIWNRYNHERRFELTNQIEDSARNLIQEINGIIKYDIQVLENLKYRLEVSDGRNFEYWDHEAKIILKQDKSFKFIEWIDSTMIIRRVNPIKGNEAAIGLDISKFDYRIGEWLKHKEEGSTNITPWAALTQGGNAFLVDVPVYYNNRFQGTITAGMDFKNNLDEITKNLVDYTIEIKDENGTLFYSHNASLHDVLDNESSFSKNFTIDKLDKQQWTLKISPTPASFAKNNDESIINMLIFGVSLSTLLSLLIYFYLKAKTESLRVIKVLRRLKKSNKKLTKERKKAEKASEAKTVFLANMSHEIRTPLNAILGFIQILKNSKDVEINKTYLKLMDRSSKNLLSLVNNVLEIDEIESGKIQLFNQVFNPSEEIASTVSQYENKFKQKNLDLDLEFISKSNNMVVGDEGKYNQVLINLIKNALKFTNRGGAKIKYEERVFNDKLYVKIRIKDTGLGIHKANLTSIFERFTQIDVGLKKKHKGSGLGLSISNQLVQLMGGTISVESKLHQGAEFIVEIPFTLSKSEVNKTSELKDIYFNNLNVLIVDDNKVNILVLAEMLKQLGVKSDKALNGVEAIEQVKNNSYHLILMDIHMPIMDGFEATQIIRKENKEVLILGLSADVTKNAISKSLEIGMNDYLTKPLSKDKLHQVLTKYFSEKLD